jgi:hypothetical protein
MKYVLFLIAAIFSSNVSAQVVIGFMGKDSVFDHTAFVQYALAKNLQPVVLEANQTHRALQVIKSTTYYELYGYSLGAASVLQVVRSAKKPPRLVITIGAYRGLDLDFRKFGVEFYNFFDYSSVPTSSPGLYISASHWHIQQIAVNILVTGL